MATSRMSLNECSIFIADRTKVASNKKTPKRKCLQSDVPSSGDSSSSSSHRSRLRSSQNTPTKDDVDVKPTCK